MQNSLNFEKNFLRYVIGIAVFVLLIAAGLYATLGTYSRYGGDDYCEAARVRASSPLAAVFDRYFDEDWPRPTMRYSNLLFVGISESLGRYNMPITMAFMVVLWFVGCVWSVCEIRRFLKIDWAFWVDLFLGLIFGFFCIKLAPNLFETVYWRSAMMTHFAPLVFGLLLLSFLIRQARISESRSPSLWIYFFILAATYVIAGFSEPPTTTLLTAIPLLMITVWLWGKPPAKRRHLALLGAVFAGAFLGLLTMLLSPASADAAQAKTLNIIQLLSDSFRYSYQFIVDSLRTQPLPLFLCMLIPFILVWLDQQLRPSELSHKQKRAIEIAMISIPILVWLLIAAGFSPSAYGQSFPVERMRFLGRAIMIAALMLEGLLLGLLMGRVKFQANLTPQRTVLAVLFVVTAIGYPVRTTVNILQSELPEYRTRAEQWDARDAAMRAMKNDGVRDLTVPFLSTEVIQDLGDRSGFRLNRCASVLYGVDSILALPMGGE
ncbi:MAG TPA: DUF6056 family protein [Anaerolineales bacterium]|nr:DUF6056 family protein [Anaerolineales bacterium]